MWSRRDSNPRPAKETYVISTCLVTVDFRDGHGQSHTKHILIRDHLKLLSRTQK